MKSNHELQIDIQNGIMWEPLLSAAEIGVTVHDGVVTLSGIVDSYAKKIEAENVTKNMAGVKAIVEKIEVQYGQNRTKIDDIDIANEILKVFKWNWKIPRDKVKVKVEKGWVQLEGEVAWHYQKEEAKEAIKNLAGIIGVTNKITIKPESLDAMEKTMIEHHLQRSWALKAHEIKVDVNGTSVTLNGTVSSLYQKDEAGRIAWNTPGIWTLHNHLNVVYDFA